jgi:signal peptidase II
VTSPKESGGLVGWWRRSTPETRILGVGGTILLLDHLSKLVIVLSLRLGDHWPVLPGFLHIVHWGNTGSAWSLFHGNNTALAVVALVAVGALWYWRAHFEAHRPLGQLALGLLFGGTIGNLIDRLIPSRRHVVDFLYFHLHPRGGGEAGFPAFNVADVAICTGVGLMLLLGFAMPENASAPQPKPSSTEAAEAGAPGSPTGKPVE